MKKEREDGKNKLNSDINSQINRGFELMLRQYNRREEPSQTKTFEFAFGKMLSLLKREIHFGINLFLDVKKK